MNARTLLISAGLATTMAVMIYDRRATQADLAKVRGDLAALASTRATEAAAYPAGAAAAAPASVTMLAARGLPNPAGDARPDGAPPSPAARHAKIPNGMAPNMTATEAFADVRDSVESVFVGEASDPSWARDARRTAESTFSEKLPAGSRIAKVECRSTICRVETVHDSVDRSEEFMNAAVFEAPQPAWKGAVATGVTNEAPNGGPVTMVTYLMREGHQLPPMSADD